MKRKKLSKQKIEDLEERVEDAESYEISATGNAIIDVNAKSVEDFYSPYSPTGYRLLNSELVSYIDEYIEGIPAKQGFELRLQTNLLEPEEKSKIVATIKRTYAEKIANINVELKHNFIQSLLFCLIGIGFMLLLFISNTLEWGFIADCVLDILSWVFLWEGVDTFCFERFKQNKLKLKYAKLVMADIKFKEM
ncbi:MAG: hypothetical protein ACI4T8_01480 [Christensenellales bacterium]